MKKYIKPQIEVSNIELSSMICTSDWVEKDLGTIPPIQNKKDILSKEYSFEDDWGYEE